jgi:hypothetical protein
MKMQEILEAVKQRDPSSKTMQDIRKSGAAGAHKDKKKVLPRKEKHKGKAFEEYKHADHAKGKDPMPKKTKPSKGSEQKHPLKGKLVGEAQINEIAPAVYAAVMWVLGWAGRRAAWPVLRWVIKRHLGKLAIGATAAYYIDQGWDWVISVVGEEAAQMLIDNKFNIAMAVALILGAVTLQKFFMKKGDEMVAKYQESISEMTSAGAIGAVAMPIGQMHRRVTKKKKKKA